MYEVHAARRREWPSVTLVPMVERHAAGATAASSTRLVVRVDGTWALTPPEGRDPIPLDLDQLLELLRTGEQPPGSTLASTVLGVGLHPLAELGPVGPVVAKVGGGCLVLEDPAGRRVALDEVDVVLLDAVVEECTAEVVMARTRSRLGPSCPGDEELRGRLRRIVEAVPLRLLFDPAPDWLPPAAPPLLNRDLLAHRLRKVLRRAVPSPLRSRLRRHLARGAADHDDRSVEPDGSSTRSGIYLEDPVPADDAAAGRGAG